MASTTPEEQGPERILTTSDGGEITFSSKMLEYVKRIWATLEVSEATDEPLPLNNVSKRSLELIRRYTENRVNCADGTPWKVPSSVVENKNFKENSQIQDADKELLQDLDFNEVVSLLKASNEYEIEDLKTVCAVWIAHFLYGKDTYQIRKELNIVNDYTPEQEKEFTP